MRNSRGTLEGSRRAFSADFIRTLADDFHLHGRQAIEKVRKQQPAAYLKICALLVPREMKLEHSGGVKAMTDEELERGIELLKEAIAKRDAAANAKVVEGVPEPVPALPPPSRKARRKVRRSDRADSGLAARVAGTEPNGGMSILDSSLAEGEAVPSLPPPVSAKNS